MNSSFEWQFGGWLQALPPAVAWSLIGLLGVCGVGLIVFSYRHTLRALSARSRWMLSAFRAVILIVVLVCLANPVRVDRSKRDRDSQRRLAVVVDRSASMNAVDNRSETRLGNAVRIWKQHEEEARQSFDSVDYYRFSSKLEKNASLDAAVQAADPGTETHLFAALNQVLDDAPAGIVCLTDGLDTTGEEAAAVVSRAQRQGVPVYFVAGANRSRMGELFDIREVKTPSRVLRRSQFTAGIALEIVSRQDREVPVSLWSKDQKLADAKLKVRAGWNVLPWTAQVTAGESGPMPLEFRLGEGPDQEIAASTTQVVNKNTVDILYYQGALEWGYRFLLSALQSDPSFKMTSILNPALGMQMATADAGKLVMSDLPENAEALKQFQIIILAHVYADQLSAKQQQALVDFAKNGGGVLFIAPDAAAATQFAGTRIEQMLPVVFEPPPQQSREDSAAAQFQEHMESLGGANGDEESVFAESALRRQQIVDLKQFRAPAGAAGSKLFAAASNAPRFSDYTQVRNVKAGAVILAVHPIDRTEDGAPRVLVARQQFGNGFTAAMTTDLLWRWKLSLPSTSHAVEIFWQQFMLSLSPMTSGRGLRLVKKDDAAAVSHPVTIRIEGSSGGVPKVFAVSPQGVQQALVPKKNTGADGDSWQTDFIPDSQGRWEVLANDAAAGTARITLPVSTQVRTVETMNLPTDIDTLRRIAADTGGALIENGASAFRARAHTDDLLETKRTQPLWNTRWLIALMLGVYSTELVTRRLLRLL